MFGKKRIRCKIVNYSDGTILQRATDSNHKKKYFIGNMKYCNKDNTVLEFTVGEAFGLSWDCIDFKKKTLTVNKQVQWDDKMQCWYFTAPKYDSFRTIEIDDELVAIFARLKDKQIKAKTYYAELYTELYESNKRAINAKEGTPIELVCIRENGTYIQPRTMQHTASIIHHKMNYPEFTFHSLRHTHATILAENDVPPKYVQERLGHKDIYTTLKFYQHLTKKISEKGTGIMSKIFATT